MPKAKNKVKNLEVEDVEREGEMKEDFGREEKSVEENKKEKAGKAKRRRPRRFLACLQRAWAALTSRISRRESVPKDEPSKTSVADKKAVSHTCKEYKKSVEEKHHSPKKDGEMEDIVYDYVEEQLLHYKEIQEQMELYEAAYIQHYAVSYTCNQKEKSVEEKHHSPKKDGETEDIVYDYVEQQLLHYKEIQDQMEMYEAGYIQHYGDLEKMSREDNREPTTSKGLISCQKEEERDSVCVAGTAAKPAAKKKNRMSQLTLKSFIFHEEIGLGACGKVLLAKDKIRKEHVAIKMVNKCIHLEENFSPVERDILYFSHENAYLVHGLAAFHTERYLYYVMELATQGDLHRFINKSSPLDVASASFVTAQTICALQFLHNRGIVHRDVKPMNIFLTREGHVKLGDFGICIMDVQDKINGKCPGTRGFKAPEIYNMMPYGRGVDYFALGVTLYFMLTGQYPFKFSGEAEVTETPDYPPALTPESIDILNGLLDKDQESRLGVNGNIRQHPFFADLSWNELETRTAVPPERLVSVHGEKTYCRTLKHKEEPFPFKSPESFTDFSFVSPAWSTDYRPATNSAKRFFWL